MNRRKLAGLFGVAAGLALVAGFALAAMAGGFGGEADGTEASADAESLRGGADSVSSTDQSGVGEGVDVHGDWVIEVKNPDGSLAERREFENGLVTQGSFFLAHLLERTASMGTWAIVLSQGGGGPCLQNGTSASCVIRESAGGGASGLLGTHFPNLTLSSQQNPNEFILQGNFVAEADGQVGLVRTMACYSMAANIEATLCNNTSTFTERFLATPVDVAAGQQVLVTVRISFS